MIPPRSGFDALWRRLEERPVCLVDGALPEALPAPRGVAVLRVRCRAQGQPLAPIFEAAVRAAEALGEDPEALFEPAPSLSLRRRMAGQLHEARILQRVLAVLQALGDRSTRAVVLVLDEAAHIDAASASLLADLVTRRRFPLLLVLARGEDDGNAAWDALHEVFTARFGPALDGAPKAPSQPASALEALSPETCLTVRALSVAGAGATLPLLAALRGIPEARVLEHLQAARDAGFPIADRGAGGFALPEGVREAVRATVLPSLARRWNLGLAAHYARPRRDPERSAARFARGPSAPSGGWAAVYPEAPARQAPPGPAAPPTPALPTVHLPDAPIAPSPAVSPPQVTSFEEAVPKGEGRPRVVIAPPQEPARAAVHLEAAGDLAGAARTHLAAALQELGAGLYNDALATVERARELLDAMPEGPARRALRVELLTTDGRVRWAGSGPGEAFTLPRAIASLREARGLADEGTPPSVRSDLAVALAGALHDSGELGALEEALAVLTDAARRLGEQGDAVGAACLLNDQAAVYVRLGDPVRAAYLLEQSRQVFSQKAAEDPRASQELAQTDHLLARLPLHAAPREGREAQALSLAREHGVTAEEAWRHQGAQREALRVSTTIARLDLRAGRHRHAEERLRKVLEAQRLDGDMVGLAGTTSALAETLVAAGRPEEALRCLSDSIAFNLEKVSPAGLAFNRQALEAIALEGALPSTTDAALKTLRGELEAAEAIVGRVQLPGLA